MDTQIPVESKPLIKKAESLIFSLVVIAILTYMFTIGNNKTDSVIWRSLEAHAQGLSQEQRVEKLLTEPTIENYETSLPDYYEFGERLKEEIKGKPRWELPTPTVPKLIRMLHHSEYQEMVYNYMYHLYPNVDMLATFKGEGGLVEIDQPSNSVGFDGKRAYGFCQLYYTYHKDFIDSPDFMDYRKQAERCVAVYKDAERRGILRSTFQAYPKRATMKKFFEIL